MRKVTAAAHPALTVRQFMNLADLSEEQVKATDFYAMSKACWEHFGLKEADANAWARIADAKLTPGSSRRPTAAPDAVDHLTALIASTPIPRKPATPAAPANDSTAPKAGPSGLNAALAGLRESGPSEHQLGPQQGPATTAVSALKSFTGPAVTSSSFVAEFSVDDIEMITGNRPAGPMEAKKWIMDVCESCGILPIAGSATTSTFASTRTVQIAMTSKEDQLKLIRLPFVSRDVNGRPDFVGRGAKGQRRAVFREPFRDGISQHKPNCIQLIDVPMDVDVEAATKFVEQQVEIVRERVADLTQRRLSTEQALKSVKRLQAVLDVNPVLVHERCAKYMPKRSMLAQGNHYRLICVVPCTEQVLELLTKEIFLWKERSAIVRIVRGAVAPPEPTPANAFTVFHAEPNFMLTGTPDPEPSVLTGRPEPSFGSRLKDLGAARVIWMSKVENSFINEKSVAEARAAKAPDPMFTSKEWRRLNYFHVVLEQKDAQAALEGLLGGIWRAAPLPSPFDPYPSAPRSQPTPMNAVSRPGAYQQLGTLAAVPYESLFPCTKCAAPSDYARKVARILAERGYTLVHRSVDLPGSHKQRDMQCAPLHRKQAADKAENAFEAARREVDTRRDAASAAEQEEHAARERERAAARAQKQEKREADCKKRAAESAQQQAADAALAASMGVRSLPAESSARPAARPHGGRSRPARSYLQAARDQGPEVDSIPRPRAAKRPAHSQD
eukprot:tig00000262_g23069.t2